MPVPDSSTARMRVCKKPFDAKTAKSVRPLSPTLRSMGPSVCVFES
jgi:hypothetical protein